MRVRFLSSIRRVCSWVPVLWNNYDFDWSYIYILLEAKLRRMADGMEKWGMHIGKEKTVKDIRIAAALSARIIKDDYYGDQPEIGPWRHNLTDAQIDRILKRDPRRGRKMWYPEYMLNQDIEYLHKFMTKKVQFWWD